MSSEASNICVVCFKNVDIYSIGCCDHVVCYECSTRMRVLCRQNVCSICRQEMQLVVFTKEVKPFSAIQTSICMNDKKYNIAFATKDIRDAFYKLLEHRCKICQNRTFGNFQALNDHMRRTHELFFCDLCIDNLKILSSERKCYNRADLGHHRRKGDVDDTSHRGHPLCEFCDTRYVDMDDLYRHLRRDHLFCHFCDAEGLQYYYSSYDHLRQHFREEHYLCEEGACLDEKFTPVFRTEIDLRAHRAADHGRSIGKAAAKQARTLEVEFTLKPRTTRPQDRRRRGPFDRNNVPEDESFEFPQMKQVAPPPTPSLDSNDFPSLGGSTAPVNIAPVVPRNSALTIKSVGRKGPQYDQHFPGLPSSSTSAAPSTSVQLNINQEPKSGSSQSQSSAAPKVSIHVNHRPARNVSVKQDDFPALSGSTQTAQTSKWVSVTAKKSSNSKPAEPKPSKPPKPRDEDFPSLSSKFTTNLNFVSCEPVRSAKVNIKNELSKATTKALPSMSKVKPPEKKTSSVSIAVDKSWPAPEQASSKGKTKKKKKGASDDTAKKKDVDIVKKAEVKKEPSASINENSNKENDASGGKPLPTAADWFGQSPSNDSDEINYESKSLLNFAKENTQERNPPPGFAPINGTSSAPPGLTLPPTNGFIFTNSSGENFPIRPNFPYLPPHDADARNVRLIEKVNAILSDNASLEDFRKRSMEFREGEISAEDYYQHCLKTMGAIRTSELLPELLALLPDIIKQQELFQTLVKHNANRTDRYRLESCNTCQQVVMSLEMKQHIANHLLPFY